jgi:phosphoglycolate phosphatase
MKKYTKLALISDLDGTLYNWVDFYALSFRAMVHVLGRITKLDEKRIIESFRQVYLKHKTVEYAFAIQELDIWESLRWTNEEIMENAVKPARVAFRMARSKNLQLYPHVKETLDWARTEGLLIIAYSNSPRIQAEMRLKYLRIDRFFDELWSWYSEEIPTNVPKEVLNKYIAGKYDVTSLRKSEFSLAQSKPNQEILQSMLEKHDLHPEKTYIVGDNLYTDISAAQEAGIRDIWSRYSQVKQEKNLDTLRQITPWSDEEIARDKESKRTITPTYTIDDFEEIKKIIGSRQLSLPI